MQKKLILTVILTSLFPLLNAQDMFSGNIRKFENKDNGNIIGYAQQLYTRSCADPSSARCVNALNADDSAFKAYDFSDERLALFLLQNGFSLKASGRLGESAVYLLAQITDAYNPAETQSVINGIFNKISKDDFDRLITGQDTQSSYNAVHIAVLYMPKNKAIKTMPDALQPNNRKASVQSILLSKLAFNADARQSLCKALVAPDGLWETPFHIAVKNDNKEAFLNLAEAGKNAGCDKKEILSAIAQPDKTGLSVTDFAVGKATKSKRNNTKDTFYFNVITTDISDFSDGNKDQADNIIQKLKNAKGSDADNVRQAASGIFNPAGINRAVLD